MDYTRPRQTGEHRHRGPPLRAQCRQLTAAAVKERPRRLGGLDAWTLLSRLNNKRKKRKEKQSYRLLSKLPCRLPL